MEFLSPALRAACGAVLGGIVGSFLNVVILRLPRGHDLIWQPSHCPNCGAAISWYDNVPVLGYLHLRGRCRACRVGIGIRYPLVELLTAVVFALIAAWAPDLPSALMLALAAALMIVLAGIDWDHLILPDELNFLLAASGVVVAGLWFGRPAKFLALDMLVGPLFLGVVAAAYRLLRGQEGVGFGDIKLMAGVGAWIGGRGALAAITLGSLIGSLVGVAVMLLRGGGMRQALPFGPFLIAGALVWLLADLAGVAARWLPPIAGW